jgi:4-amino-4-deoxy-L-arabinose transferase-like glycosyltransferase
VHPALSYFDHPPLHAWIQGAVRTALGTSLATLRLAPTVTTCASAAVLARLVRRYTPGLGPGGVATAVVAVFAVPLVLMFTGFAWMDHLVVLLGLLALDRFGVFYGEVAAGHRGETRTLLAGALALGLAGLAKYNAAFLGLALAAVAAWEPRLRRLWREPRFWLAAATAVALLAPVLAWNVAHGFASFRFHLLDRHHGGAGLRLSAAGPLRFLLPWLVLSSPFLLAALGRPLGVPAATPEAEVRRKLAVAGLLVPTAAFVVVGTFSTALYYWNLVGLLPLLPWAGALLERPRLLGAHLAFGAAVAVLLAVHGAGVPLTALVAGVDDDESRNPWGWERVAAAVVAERERTPGAFVAASDYRSGAALGFALLARGLPSDAAEVVVLSPRRSAFDDWRDDRALAGRTAVLVTDRHAPMGAWLEARFGEVERAETVEVTRLGVPMKPWEIWRAAAYRLVPAEPPAGSR